MAGEEQETFGERLRGLLADMDIALDGLGGEEIPSAVRASLTVQAELLRELYKGFQLIDWQLGRTRERVSALDGEPTSLEALRAQSARTGAYEVKALVEAWSAFANWLDEVKQSGQPATLEAIWHNAEPLQRGVMLVMAAGQHRMQFTVLPKNFARTAPHAELEGARGGE